jgi:hypothetical protein
MNIIKDPWSDESTNPKVTKATVSATACLVCYRKCSTCHYVGNVFGKTHCEICCQRLNQRTSKSQPTGGPFKYTTPKQTAPTTRLFLEGLENRKKQPQPWAKTKRRIAKMLKTLHSTQKVSK